MTVGIATFLTFRQANYSTVVARYQSYWPDLTVDGHSFYPFNTDAIVSNTTGGQQGLGVAFALSKSIVDLIEAALTSAYLVEVQFYLFAPTANGSPPGVKELFASFLGEVTVASSDEANITVQIGASLDPVNAQAPPRKFTTTLVGEPPKI